MLVLCPAKLCFLGFLLTFVLPVQSAGICGSCVYPAQCPLVMQILDSHPHSTHSYFYAAVSCGLDGLICCDPNVVRLALAEEATVAEKHRNTFEDIVDVYNYFGNPVDEALAPQGGQGMSIPQQAVDEKWNEQYVAVSHRLKENTNGYKVNGAVCGSNTKLRIIGGEEASTGMFPWMARLGYRARGSVSTPSVNYRCGGALITARHVLTAAHCLVRLPQSTYLAVVKLGAEGTPTQSFSPERIIPHADYNRPRLQNDIGLLRLNRTAIFTETIMPICLPFGEFAVNLNKLPTRSMLVAGWGSTDADSSSLSPTLQFIRLTYQDREECADVYAKRFNLTIGPNQLCTVGEKDRDSCGGDSGGPVFVWDGKEDGARAVGLVSFGARRCGTRGVPTVYTKIAAYQRWIEDTINNEQNVNKIQ